jgi:hypothetical protein
LSAFPEFAVGDREFLAEEADLFAEALALLKRSAKSRAGAVIVAAVSGWEAWHNLAVAAESLDLLTELGLRIEELPADAGRRRNGGEADGDPGLLEGLERLADACLSIPRSLDGCRPDCVGSLIAHGSLSGEVAKIGQLRRIVAALIVELLETGENPRKRVLIALEQLDEACSAAALSRLVSSSCAWWIGRNVVSVRNFSQLRQAFGCGHVWISGSPQ